MTPHKELLETLANEAKKISEPIRRENERKKKIWEGSPFQHLKEMSATLYKGKNLSSLIFELIKHEGFDAKFEIGNSREPSRIILGKEIIQTKTSMLSEGKYYAFQQIRPKDTFHALIFLGVSPQNAHCWVVNRGDILDSSNEWIEKKGLSVQHGTLNKSVRVDINNVPEWLSDLGGDLEKGLDVFEKEFERLEEIKNKP